MYIIMEKYLENLFRRPAQVQQEETQSKIIQYTRSLVSKLNKSVKQRGGREITQKELMNVFKQQTGGNPEIVQVEAISNNFCRDHSSQCGDSFAKCGQAGGGEAVNPYNEVLETTLKRSKRFKISKKNKDLLKYIVHTQIVK
jgi:hypothetical protein